MRLFKILIILALITFSNNKVAFSASGEASVYEITIQQIALCETGSALDNCLNPVVVYEADSGTIDIASTTAGAAAATLGSATEAVVGTSYTYVQVVMNRLITISGTGISDGSATCGTDGGTAGTVSANATGIADAGAGELVVAAGYAGALPGTNAFSGHTAVTEVTQDENLDPAGDTYFQWRVALTSPFVYDGIQNPNVTVAFGTDNALTFTGSGTCVAYASAPDVTITIN
ncbi:hypothetical protein OAP22_03670 [Candidatus Pelagibacter ubique]|nr:hypothetical protein [Candidatus Pelagibacter ubique]